jgi:hypothetical protein
MKHQLNEIRRMQQLAGIISESQLNENDTYLDQKSRAKEWLQLAFDGEEIDPEVEEKVDALLDGNTQMTEDLFREIWASYTKKYSTGDVGADWDSFEPTFKWIMDGDESHFSDYY